jgi:hypothetical protein
MNSLYFLASLIGIAWLCVWSVLPRPGAGKGWWPFDMRADARGSATGQDEPAQRRSRDAPPSRRRAGR